jgi:hypothetical protein
LPKPCASMRQTSPKPKHWVMGHVALLALTFWLNLGLSSQRLCYCPVASKSKFKKPVADKDSVHRF